MTTDDHVKLVFWNPPVLPQTNPFTVTLSQAQQQMIKQYDCDASISMMLQLNPD